MRFFEAVDGSAEGVGAEDAVRDLHVPINQSINRWPNDGKSRCGMVHGNDGENEMVRVLR